MIVAFSRYSRDASFQVLAAHKCFVLTMAVSSLAGSLMGGALVGAVPEAVLIPALSVILWLSAVKVWRRE